jgi:hypothetical protein
MPGKSRFAAIVAALCSALLSFGILYAPTPISGVLSDWWAGFIFGALVLSERDAPLWRSALFVLASTAVYWCAQELVARIYLQLSVPLTLLCSSVGAAAAFALYTIVRAATRRSLRSLSVLVPVLFGAAGGFLLALFFGDDESPYGLMYLISGYAVWQVGFAATCGFVPWWWRRAPPAGSAAPQPS